MGGTGADNVAKLSGVASSKAAVPSPTATGGAGNLFEQNVGAFWLAQLLVQATPPILLDCRVSEVHFQTRRLGWATDDILVVGETGSDSKRRIAIQVKRSFRVSKADDESKETFLAAWEDFQNGSIFSEETDRIAVITLHGTTALLRDFAGLTDCARAATNAADFENRLRTPEFVNHTVRTYHETIKAIIEGAEDQSVAPANVWPFLRRLHLLSLDLTTGTNQTEASVLSILRLAAEKHDASHLAQASWNELVRIAGEAMKDGRSLRRDDLPKPLRDRHSSVATQSSKLLGTLKEHGETVLRGIRSTIGDSLHLERRGPVRAALDALEEHRVVILTGAAGSGKSCTALDVMRSLGLEHFTFAFRAEELAEPHLDKTLHAAHFPANGHTLAAVLAAQNRKVLLVESVERLLEKSTREAFSDLLRFVNEDPTWRLIMTCREYSVDLVRTAFLLPSVGHAVVRVPPLDDSELEVVRKQYPALSTPLANSAIRRLLRNPYVLDRALQINWSSAGPLPRAESDFQAVFWKQIVRADHQGPPGMPQRRADALIAIALKRARALSLFVPCPEIDAEVIESLARDSLLIRSPHGHALLAPAHDVLEDWALAQWIDELFATHENDLGAFAVAIGPHPAVRRTYRKWVETTASLRTGLADRLFAGGGNVPSHFRDDTLASLLRAAEAPTLLDRRRDELLASEMKLLRRVIHLLRVACVTLPEEPLLSKGLGSTFDVPQGPAWPWLLSFVATHYASFGPGDRQLLLGFVEDWAKGVNAETPYPEGAEAALTLAYRLLPEFEKYQADEERKRVLQVIVKLPLLQTKRLKELLESDGEDKNPWRAGRDVRKMVLGGFDGYPAARDTPDLLMAAAKRHLLLNENDLKGKRRFGRHGIEELFGVKELDLGDFSPASAYQGPFLPLLRHHPGKGVDFVLEIVNRCTDWYARPRVSRDSVEEPTKVTIRLPDGTSRVQWSNGRLWNLYRATSVGPDFVQSLLMALEEWLLWQAKTDPEGLDDVLVSLIRRSESAAITAVVASVATAHPRQATESLLALLGCPAFFRLDVHRLVNESQATAIAQFPELDRRKRIFKEERKRSNALGHRERTLETAIVNAQIGPGGVRIREALDRVRAAIPPTEKQTADDRAWRLALHRMDLRNYRVGDELTTSSPAPAAEKTQPRGFQLEPLRPEADLQAVLEESRPYTEALAERQSLFGWAFEVFQRKSPETYDPAQWRDRLAQARSLEQDEGVFRGIGAGGPGFVAAVCIRDHWPEMAPEERGWCVDTACHAVEEGVDNWNDLARVQRYQMAADRPCAWVIPRLMGRPLPADQKGRVQSALIGCLTHPVEEVRHHAADGVGSHLWSVDRSLTLRCVDAIAWEARQVQASVDDDESSDASAEVTAAAEIRKRFYDVDFKIDGAYSELDVSKHFGSEANLRILRIFSYAPTDSVAVSAFERAAAVIVGWWDSDEKRHDGPNRDWQIEAAQEELIPEFVLRTPISRAVQVIDKVVEAVERHPRNAAQFLLKLISVEDRHPNTGQFWALWELFADRCRAATWLKGIDQDHRGGKEMVSALFLGPYWKDATRHWRSLEGHATVVDHLFTSLPASATVLDYYLNFLYHVGERSLPQAFAIAAKRIESGDSNEMLRNSNTVFLLEVLLQRHVYARSLELKESAPLRQATLELLDLLVEHGSSAAFRMRDDFVTPANVA